MQISGNYRPSPVVLVDEQVASTSTSNEWAWVIVALALVIITAGLYWFNDRQDAPPDRSDVVVVDEISVGERPAEFVISDQALADPKNSIVPQPTTFTPAATIPNSNERLVRRVYNEVINGQQLAVMDQLFADQVAYGRSGPMTIVSLTMLREQIRTERSRYAELSYSIEQVFASENLVGVEWSAAGTPLSASTSHPLRSAPQVWSGYTIWKVVDSEIVQMWTQH